MTSHCHSVTLSPIGSIAIKRNGRTLRSDSFRSAPAGYGIDLWGVYVAWALIVAAIFPACRWYAGVKRRSASPWLSYL